LTLHNILKNSIVDLDKKKIKNISKDFDKARKKFISKAKPFKNTTKVLKELSKNHKLVLISNNHHNMIEYILNKTKIDKKFFSLIIGSDDVKRPKPYPDGIKKAKKELKGKVMFMVGDSKPDIESAKKAKVKSIVILPKSKQIRKDLKEADYKIKDIIELLQIIKKE